MTGGRAGRGALLFVLWSLGICVVCAVAYVLVFPVVLPGLNTPPVAAWLLERMPAWGYNVLARSLFTVAMTAFLAAMTVALIAGPRTLRARITRRGVALTACGLLLAAVNVVGPMLWYAGSRSRVDEMQSSGRAWKADLRQRLESGKVPEPLRERMWLIYARGVYQDEGIAVRIPDPAGNMISFEPSESDIAARRSYLQTLEGLEPPDAHVRGAATWVAFCLAIGLLWPPRRAAAGPDPRGTLHISGTGPAGGE